MGNGFRSLNGIFGRTANGTGDFLDILAGSVATLLERFVVLEELSGEAVVVPVDGFRRRVFIHVVCIQDLSTALAGTADLIPNVVSELDIDVLRETV